MLCTPLSPPLLRIYIRQLRRWPCPKCLLAPSLLLVPQPHNADGSYRANQWPLSQRCNQEQQRHEDVQSVARDKQHLAVLREEESWEMRRQVRQMQEEHRDRELKSALLKANEDRINRAQELEQEMRMAEELARISLEKERDEKMRQHIRENSLEIRELESKLKSAYLNKGRAAQIAEQEAMRLETLREKADYSGKMKRESERATVEQQQLEQKRQEELTQYQRALEQQLMDRERGRQQAYEEFLKEKLLVDEIIRKIYEEDQMERELKLEKIRATQQHIEEFKRQQAQWRRMEQERMEAENRRIMKFASQQQNMEESKMAKIKETEEAKEHLYQILCKKIKDESKQREDAERVREELFFEEQEEANRLREIEEMEKKIRERLMMQQTFQEHLAYKEMKKKAEKEEEEAFRKTMLAKFAEDDRIEQMNAQKRRMKQLVHKREVEKMIEDRRLQRQVDVELEVKERAIEQEREALRRQIVEEERKKLLKRHAAQLLGYLPKGMIREDDLQYFDEDFRESFKPRQTENISEDSWDDDA
ncbi:meiosis-specific nuclear structural protein 1 isoform X2 [Paralichthys olivaceus]|uniref:meiosis-specific nuclear structural protein 1 isoform X2 n=1 Tax=Paralichthys olivaceus TaxID=8255 RepID=UPI0037528B99